MISRSLKGWTSLFVFFLSIIIFSCNHKLAEERVLIFSKTDGFRHKSIPTAKTALLRLCNENGITADTTENAKYFTRDSLKQYSAVIFVNTSGNVLNHRQQVHFEQYIQAGGGFVGIHGASATEYNWPWYGELVGGVFDQHPEPQNATINVTDSDHPAIHGLPKRWERFDEWYNFKKIYPNINVLATIDESTYQGGSHGDHHPMVWYREFDGGRSFYTALGHTSESFEDEKYLSHILGGIKYAIGNNSLNYDLAYSKLPPEESRFVKDVLISELDEPMELEVFDDGRVLFIERKGGVKLYEPDNRAVKTIANIPVNNTFEDGLVGLAKDPDFKNNHWIYLYYAPVGDDWVMNLSRFVYAADSLFVNTEKVMLQVPVQRASCCHTGGSIEFGPDGLLYLSTGDDTNPFNSPELKHNSNGYGPMNEMHGWKYYDAQRSSSNSNDLRGKILRIKPEADGTYSIPDGNLFLKDGSRGKPEIYVMGTRNPYRIAIDQRTGILYFGDVGPDANEDSPRGPRGYDEVNQVKQPGYYGWPLFIANNKPYADFDYATGDIGPKFDPQNPVNNSPNNTGIKQLPPAQPAMVYYPYAESDEFENLESGGRNAMAGPVYYFDDYKASRYKMSSYYDGKFFFYDWMRDWIMAATFDENNDLLYYEPFLPSTKFSNIMDITFSSDGVMYMLEYGSNWFAKNKDATLSRILYSSGNRIPVAEIKIDNNIGAAPLEVEFSGEGSYDFDKKDELYYSWYLEDGEVFAEGMEASYVFNKPGVHNITLRVADEHGDFSESKVSINVGNELPDVNISINGNTSFYWDNRKLDYQVMVRDKEDGEFPNGGISANDVVFTIDYISGHDETQAAAGHQTKSDLLNGAGLLEEYNCFTCHKVDEKSIGPKYVDVANRYDETVSIIKMLARKIIEGGSGNWGDRQMAANPSVSQEDAEAMVEYILALNDEEPSLPLQGSYTFDRHINNPNGYYIFKATYKDKGGEVIGPLSASETYNFIPLKLEAEHYDEADKVRAMQVGEEGTIVVGRIEDGAYLGFDNIDLAGVKGLNIKYFAENGAGFEIRYGSVDGETIAEGTFSATGGSILETLHIDFENKPQEPQDLFITFSIENMRQTRLAIDRFEFIVKNH